MAFEFPRISDALGAELAQELIARRSVTVVGGRNVGKRYLVRRVRDELLRAGRLVGVASALNAADATQSSIRRAQPLAEGGVPLRTTYEALSWWSANASRGASLLVPNIDALPAQVGLDFGRDLRAIGWGGVMVTGEAQSLAHCGPDGTLSSDRMLAVAAFAEIEFAAFARRYLDRLALEDEVGGLFAKTGGNIYLLRVLLWASFDAWGEQEGNEADRIDLGLPDDAIESRLPWNHYVRYVTRLIGNEPSLWPRLEELIDKGVVEATPDVPDLLEMTGIPVREGGKLRVNSILGPFLKRQFSLQKMADLDAGTGDWDRAFERLEKLPQAQRLRPTSLDDVPDAAAMVKRLASSLHEAARRGPVAVEDRFRKGCRLFLGFPHVSFWMRPPRSGAGWDGLRSKEALPDWVAAALATEPVEKTGRWKGLLLYDLKDKDLERSAAVAAVPPPHEDERCRAAVAVRDDTPGHPRSQARIELLWDLIEGFQSAYSHALELDRFRRQAQDRHVIGEIVTEVLSDMGRGVLTVRQAVERAVSSLRERLPDASGRPRYRFVLVSLYDADRERVRGFYAAPPGDDSRARVEAVDYSVFPPDHSVHVAALLSGERRVIADFGDDREADQSVVDRIGLRSGALVLLDTGRRDSGGARVVLGTLLAEREDGLPPEEAEVEDLVQFGRKLAGVIEQSERTQLMEAALEQQREPLVILDAGSRVRYANKLAVEKFGAPFGPRGWRDVEASAAIVWEGKAGESLGERVAEVARVAAAPIVKNDGRSLAISQLRGRTVAMVGSPAEGERLTGAWAVLADLIGEAERPPVGAFLESQDLSFLDRLFGGLVVLLDTARLWSEAGDRPLGPDGRDLTRQLVDEVGRLLCGGLETPAVFFDEHSGVPGAGRFLRSRLYKRGEAPADYPAAPPRAYDAIGSTVDCLRLPAPVVSYYDKANRFPGVHRGFTRRGLEVPIVHAPRGAPDGLEDRALWIELPVLAGPRWLGKFVFGCSGDFPPEEFVLLERALGVLCGIVGAILELAARFERDAAERQKELKEANKKAVADFVHGVRQPIKMIQDQLAEYEKKSPPQAGLIGLHDEIRYALRLFDHSSDLAGQVTDLTEFGFRRDDLLALLSKTLSVGCPSCWELACAHDEFDAEFDPVHFGRALTELVVNSRKYGDKDALRVWVRVEATTRGDRRWVSIVYEDNGEGIKQAERAKLFSPKEKGFPRKRGGLGTGRGMNHVWRVVGAHGGTIEETGRADSQSGVRFVVEFPRYRD